MLPTSRLEAKFHCILYEVLWLPSEIIFALNLQGLGRQAAGFKVNLVAFYVVAVPVACVCGFVLHWGVEGLYCGLILGASTQAIGFCLYLRKVDWVDEARKAVLRVEAVPSTEGKVDDDALDCEIATCS